MSDLRNRWPKRLEWERFSFESETTQAEYHGLYVGTNFIPSVFLSNNVLQMRKIQGFTLVELLVVIAIISVLIALLLTATPFVEGVSEPQLKLHSEYAAAEDTPLVENIVQGDNH